MSLQLDKIKLNSIIALIHAFIFIFMIIWGEFTDYKDYPRPSALSLATVTLFFAAFFVSISNAAGEALRIEARREECDVRKGKEADKTHVLEKNIQDAVERWLGNEIVSPWKIDFEILEVWSLSPRAHTVAGISRHSAEEWSPRMSNGFFVQIHPVTHDIIDAIFVDPGLAAVRGGVMRQVRENDGMLVSDIILERFHRDVWFEDGGLSS